MVTEEMMYSMETTEEQVNFLYQAMVDNAMVSAHVWRYWMDHLNIIEENYCDEPMRWCTPYYYVIENPLNGKHYMVSMCRGNTEYQDDEWEDQVAVLCEQRAVVTYEWVIV